LITAVQQPGTKDYSNVELPANTPDVLTHPRLLDHRDEEAGWVEPYLLTFDLE